MRVAKRESSSGQFGSRLCRFRSRRCSGLAHKGSVAKALGVLGLEPCLESFVLPRLAKGTQETGQFRVHLGFLQRHPGLNIQNNPTVSGPLEFAYSSSRSL